MTVTRQDPVIVFGLERKQVGRLRAEDVGVYSTLPLALDRADRFAKGEAWEFDNIRRIYECDVARIKLITLDAP